MLSHSHLALYILSLTAQQELLSMNDVSVDWALAKNPHLNHEIWQQLYSKYAEIGSAAPHDGSLPHNLLKALHQNPRSQDQLQLLMSNPDLKVGAIAILHALPIASDQFILQLIHNPATPPEFAAAALASALSFTAPATATLLNKFIPSHLKDTLPELYNSAVIGAATLPTLSLIHI